MNQTSLSGLGLNAASVRSAPENAGATEEKKIPVWVFAAAGGGVLLLVIAAAFFLCRSPKKNSMPFDSQEGMMNSKYEMADRNNIV